MINIRLYKNEDKDIWDEYVLSHSLATCYHLSVWKNVIENTYGHKAYYLLAEESHESKLFTIRKIIGILPLVHLKNILFGNVFVSLPFFDYGGILADNEYIKNSLIEFAINLAKEMKADYIELRHIHPVSHNNLKVSIDFIRFISEQLANNSKKVRMLMSLPENSEVLFKNFKSKLRSQIRKPEKEGLKAELGGFDLLKDFYKVFTKNMRDLGSPVHHIGLMKNVLKELPNESRIGVIYKGKKPVASGLIISFKDTVFIPWASSLREHNCLSPNMMLYWNFLKYSADNNFKKFDFGRSTFEGNTFKFKQQWGAESIPLHWEYWINIGDNLPDMDSNNPKFETAIRYWKKMPVAITKRLGPRIRKYIWL